MYPSVISVKATNKYILILHFDNGESKVFDMKPLLNLGKFVELRDLLLFNTVKVSFDTVTWDNSLDLDPEYLYKNSTLLKVC